MQRPAATVLGLTLATVVLTGCGATESESARVRAVVQRYQAALVDRDGSELCSLLSSEAQHELATMAASLSAPPRGLNGRGCVAFGNLLRAVAPNSKASSRVSDARIGTPKVVGDKATVLVREPGETPRELTLNKMQTGWKITLPPASTSASFDLRGEPAVTVEPPPNVAHGGGERLAQFNLGRTVAAQTGCLACHRIGKSGNAGPGPDLTEVGARLPARGIERAIVHATAPMPSFVHLPKAKLRALVAFLSLLRG
jgi:mono/diheme cytochrome c family protein